MPDAFGSPAPMPAVSGASALDPFAQQAPAPVSAPAPAPAGAAFDAAFSTRGGEDELDALARVARQQGFSAGDNFAAAEAPASVPASLPGGMYQCVADAGGTAEFELGENPNVLRVYRAGEAFYVKEIRTTAEGRQWALTSDGAWVSLVSGSGLALLQPAAFGDQFEQPPASPARSSAASCSSPARTGPPQAMVRRIQRRSSSHATAMPRVEC